MVALARHSSDLPSKDDLLWGVSHFGTQCCLCRERWHWWVPRYCLSTARGLEAATAAQFRTSPMGSLYSGSLYQPGLDFLRLPWSLSFFIPDLPSFPLSFMVSDQPRAWPLCLSQASKSYAFFNSTLVSASPSTWADTITILGGKRGWGWGERMECEIIIFHFGKSTDNVYMSIMGEKELAG